MLQVEQVTVKLLREGRKALSGQEKAPIINETLKLIRPARGVRIAVRGKPVTA